VIQALESLWFSVLIVIKLLLRYVIYTCTYWNK
jgi:hypothetical protein